MYSGVQMLMLSLADLRRGGMSKDPAFEQLWHLVVKQQMTVHWQNLCLVLLYFFYFFLVFFPREKERIRMDNTFYSQRLWWYKRLIFKHMRSSTCPLAWPRCNTFIRQSDWLLLSCWLLAFIQHFSQKQTRILHTRPVYSREFVNKHEQ